mmetsp:Transcript_18435/g.22586  ORF Transcript_18435/g.22586 Transcript_18435/m.22586 type:complete len:93 (+) Transcript_18435:425-703(+)|eukprot:CAMPEP_0204823640 /NCGR_PEP_ID=MMETSP1346-20131115/1706_1 /ASSEMBLY_ACC=CAM_ASM_000771 /TAXON_ID=215587 /ORGANISM="Aplanochytrium stocchinoi, Strain GSBS06" /LENGTH=92 /DNA_ID=CAMNT_0051950363 /DNA_START=307 /DNA_END=585 /DNA_ORIENTATION=-
MADFKGQQLCENIYQSIILACTLFGLVFGFIFQDFGMVVKIWAFGLVIAGITCVPDWPMYNQDPISWSGSKDSASSRKNTALRNRKGKTKAK